jgi:hypothetical protein
MKLGTIAGVAASAALLVAAALAAQDSKTQDAAMTLSPEAMAAMTPGPMHAHLQPLVGSWNLTLKWRMSPDQPWTESQYTAQRELTMDGRFLEETISGDWQGMSFEGHGIIGHDNLRGEYTHVWYDNMSTGMSIGTGKADATGKVITFEGTGSDCMTGEKEKWFKSVLKRVSDTENSFQMYTKDAKGGREYVNMEITYKKK